MSEIYIILHNIRSVHNVGSILRTADGAGVKKVYMCGCTPPPVDRFGRKRSDITKVALGAERSVEWEHVEDIKNLIIDLKQKGVQVAAVEQDEKSISYNKFTSKKNIAFVFGEETKGMQKDLLSQCDVVIEIPMYGEKESLNVSVSAGIVLFRFIEQFS